IAVRFIGVSLRLRTVLLRRPPQCRRTHSIRLPRRRNGRRGEILSPVQRLIVPPQRGGQSRLAGRTGSAAEADTQFWAPGTPKVAGGYKQRVPGVPDAHAQRHGFGAHDVATRCPGLQGIGLAIRSLS
ncbi:hypothetical protein ZEAMMB73_Zm00001d043429, partial [Zea mays]